MPQPGASLTATNSAPSIGVTHDDCHKMIKILLTSFGVMLLGQKWGHLGEDQKVYKAGWTPGNPY